MFDVFIMDMGGHSENVEYLRQKFPHAQVLNWTSHISCIRRAVRKSRTRMCWVVASCVDYTNFDWLWQPSPWQEYQIHCWPSNDQPFGDTFLVPVAEWLKQETQVKELEYYTHVNYNHEALPRLPWQVINYSTDTIAEAVAQETIQTPYAIFSKNPLPSQASISTPAFWGNRHPKIVSHTAGNDISLVPRSATALIHDQVYDYPALERRHNRFNWPGMPVQDNPLDIVYISNGEPSAEFHYNVLTWSRDQQKASNRITRVKNVKGRVAAYHAAAEASYTDWFFAVFAKLEVNSDFDFNWQPDRWQQPKHYIFHALNPVVKLQYGHMGIIAYNKQLVLNNPGVGLDFTLDNLHAVVPELSGIAKFNTDPWTTWRTAFRECIKLKLAVDTADDTESDYRLKCWLAPDAKALYADWCAYGAKDAVEYYEQVNGNLAELRKSYEWDWLRSYAFIKRPNLPHE